jgi:hypothetical protein
MNTCLYFVSIYSTAFAREVFDEQRNQTRLSLSKQKVHAVCSTVEEPKKYSPMALSEQAKQSQ